MEDLKISTFTVTNNEDDYWYVSYNFSYLYSDKRLTGTCTNMACKGMDETQKVVEQLLANKWPG